MSERMVRMIWRMMNMIFLRPECNPLVKSDIVGDDQAGYTYRLILLHLPRMPIYRRLIAGEYPRQDVQHYALLVGESDYLRGL